MIERVALGRTGETIPAIGLGCAGLPNGGAPQDDATAFAAMRQALDLGMDFFDTADLYGKGLNEELLGRFMKEVGRHRVMLCTKFGSIPGGPDRPPSQNNSPEYIAAACDASLKRLGTDVIDLYYMHRRDPAVPVADSVGAMSRLVEAGKVRWLGLSEVAAKTLSDADAVHPIAAIQSEYSLWHRDVEKEVQPTCRALGVTFVPFSPLGRSFLTGALTVSDFAPTDLRSSLPRFQPDAMAQNLRLVERLKMFADRRGITPAQAALAWLLAKSVETSAVVPIPGSKRPEKIKENKGAADVKLTKAEVAELEAIFTPEAIVGERYSQIEAARAGL